ncbi:MAG: TRAP transporter small permease [Spirochaetia bacterium]|jgi:TRAP-type C4-dicarboxylate transport system permease small subunit|nr:TRAP transporter small permease [Spirochaetia bacterium]
MRKFIEYSKRLLEIVCGILLIALTIVIFAQVFSRFVLHHSFAWAEEASIYMMIWMVFLGTSVNVLKESNIRIDFFIRLFPESVQKIIGIVSDLICIGFIAILCRQSFLIVKLNLHNLAAGIKIPIAVMYAGFSVSAIIMVLYFLIRIGVCLKHFPKAKCKGQVEIND